MIFRDMFGTELKEGDEVFFPIGCGQSAKGQIVKLESGLGTNIRFGEKGEILPSQPMVLIMLVLPIGAAPNGFVGSLFKLPELKKPPVVN